MGDVVVEELQQGLAGVEGTVFGRVHVRLDYRPRNRHDMLWSLALAFKAAQAGDVIVIPL